MRKKQLDEAEQQDSLRVWVDVAPPRLMQAMRRLEQGRGIPVSVAWAQRADSDETHLRGVSFSPPIRRLPVLEPGGARVRFLKVGNIDWIEAERQYVRLHVGTERILTRGRGLTLNSLSSRLDPTRFFRVHRSHIVNLSRVEALRTEAPTKKWLELSGGQDVPVSQAYWQPLEHALERFG